MPFRFSSALSTERSTLGAAEESARLLAAGLGGAPADIIVAFVTPHHAGRMEETLVEIHRVLKPKHLVGCLAQGVIESGREVEEDAAISLWGASIPGVELTSAAVQAEETPDGLAFSGVPEIPDGPATLLLFGDPMQFPVLEFLARLAEDHPQLVVVGGMASGLRNKTRKTLLLGEEFLEAGAVCAVLSGPLRVRPVVSQGCRPFGKHLVITRATDDIIFELGGKPAFERLKQEVGTLDAAEKKLAQKGLHLGRAIDASRSTFARGDFLIRNVVGIDPKQNAIQVGEQVRAGQTVQFHLRDAKSASEDLAEMLRSVKEAGFHADDASAARSGVRGALLFSCNGRGTYLFQRPDHDASTVQRELGAIPLAGFFAAGELGPVGGRNFLHGFTASVALFEENVTR